MHCIVMSSPKKNESNASNGCAGWHIHRSVELLAYHRADECVRILFMVLAESLVDGPNVLRFLHRGNVGCSLISPSYPLPLHPDEQGKGNAGILESVYGRAFREPPACGCVREQTLTPWDAWERIARQNVTLFGGAAAARNRLSPEFEVPADRSYVPFCVWRLEPFTEKGFYLISFSLEFSGETYEHLVSADETFSVDGPQRLLSAIKYRDLPNFPGARREWEDRLRDFESEVTAANSTSYDVIILEPPFADAVHVRGDRCSNGIHRAAKHQPSESNHAVRYVTTDSFFTLPLSYAPAEARLISAES